MNITEKELAVLEAIIDNDYQSFEKSDKDLINSPTWLFVCEDSRVGGKHLSGVISSLTKKGLIGSELDKKRSAFSTIWITELGFETLQG